MPLANLDDALGLGPRLPRLGAAPRRKRPGIDPEDDAALAELQDAIEQRIGDLPAEDVTESPHGALQTALDVLDLPRNAVANIINLSVGAEPTSKETFAGLPRVSGADILRKLGLSAAGDDVEAGLGARLADAGTGLALDVAFDPLSYLSFGAAGAARAGGRALTKAGAGLVESGVRQAAGKAGRQAFERTLAERLAAGAAEDAAKQEARQAARTAVTDLQRGFGRIPETHPAYTADPRGGLGLAYDTQRGTEGVRGIVAEQLAQKTPEIFDDTAISLGVPFTGTHIPLVSKTALRGAAEATGLAPAARAVGGVLSKIPGVPELAAGVKTAGREIRRRFSTTVLPAIPGDAADAARFEAESFQRFAEQATARAMRRVGVEESRKLNQWIGEIEKQTGLKRPVARAAVFALAERVGSRDPGNVIAQRVSSLVRELGGTDEQAGKLVRWIAAEEEPLRTAMGRVPDLSPEIDLFGNPIYEPLDGPQLTLWDESAPQRPARIEAAEPSDTLRAMVAQVVPTIPGKTAPAAGAVKKALIDRYGARSVEEALRDGVKLRTGAADAQVQGAIDHATKGGWLFGAPGETVAGAAEKSGAVKDLPDLAPVRRTLGEPLTMLDGAMNEYGGELAVVDADQLLTSHRPVKYRGEIVRVEPAADYPVGFQARERSADASLAQIRGIAKNPKFELLLDFGPDVTSGPPIVANIGGRDVVVQGNGRTAGMLGWTDAQWEQYRAAMGERIDLPAGVKRPVLVRRLTDSEDAARRMAALGNESAMLRKSRIERAREALNLRAGDTIPPVRVNEPVTRDNVGSVLADSSNRPFYEWLMRGVPPQRRAELLADPQALSEKVNDAFVAMLPRKVQDIAAGMPQEVEDMFTAAAPIAARIHTAVREGRVRPEYDLYSGLEQAANLFSQMRSKGGSYKKIISDLDQIATTETFAGMGDDLSAATQRGLALAVGLVKSSRSLNPTESLLEGLNTIARTALADDPRQLGFLAADPVENAARLYLDTFVGPKQTEGLLKAMQSIKSRGGGAGAALGGELGAAGGVGVASAADAAATAAGSGRREFYDDVRKWAAAAGVGDAERDQILSVMDRFSDDSVRGLRLQQGDAQEAARVASIAGRKPAAAFYYDDLLKPEEKAVLGARGIVRLFQRAGKDYDDAGLLLEEFGHHVHRNVLTDADRDVVRQWYAGKTPEQWAAELREAGIRKGEADYYAHNEYELFSRKFADYVMGKEVAAAPEMRTLWQKTLDVLRDVWESLVGSGKIEPDRKIAEIIDRHYAAPRRMGVSQAAADVPAGVEGGVQRGLFVPPEPSGVSSAAPLPGRSGPQPPLFDELLNPPPIEARGPLGMPRGAAQDELRFPRTPVGPPGELRMSDPVREVVDYLQGRANLRVTAERAAGVPSKRLTTEREVGHLTRFLMDDPKSKLGGLMRSAGMKVKSWAQLQRADWWREKFADEINELVEGVNQFQRGASAGDARVHGLVEALGLKRGETLPTVLMDPVVAHVAREMESVKLIGSAEFLREAARRFGVAVKRGETIPAGLTKVSGKQFGDLLDDVAFRPEVAHLLERHLAQWQEVSKPLAGYRKVLGLWKGAALLAPAYHLRNIFGNVWNASLLDGFSVDGWRDAITVQQAIARGTNLRRRIAGTHYTAESLWKKMAVDGGVLGSGFFGTEGRVTQRRVSEMLEALDNPATAKRSLAEGLAGHPFKANYTMGQIFEEQAKLGFVITRLRAGDDLGTALTKMKKSLFDYGDLTDFERGTATSLGLRDILPFYSWTRKNSELLLTLAFTNPGRLALVPKLQGDAESALAGKDTLPPSLRPAFVQQEGGIQVSGGTKPQFLNAGYMLPVGELGLINPLAPRQAAQKVLDSVAGPAKTAIELATNYDSFQDKPIREYPEQRKEFLGVDVPPELAHVARSVRPLNFGNQVLRSIETSQTPEQAAGNVAAQTVGVRTFPVDVPRQIFEAERRINEQVGAVRRDMKRRMSELDGRGVEYAGDGELARLLGQLQELTARRSALPLRDVRAALRPLSERRKQRLTEYVAAGRQTE